MRALTEIPITHNIPILVRSALNVPVANGSVTNSYRLRRALPTLQHLQRAGARVIVASHLGEQGTETLEPVARELAKLLSRVTFCPVTVGAEARARVRALAPGDILVLENVRRNAGEIKNDLTFAKELATLADVFVQDSFDTCHRAHSSIVRLPELLPAYAGLELVEEVRVLGGARTPKSPSLAIIGGVKFSTKEPVLTELLRRYKHVFVGGALANDFLKAGGHPVGRSLVSNSSEAQIKTLLLHPRLVLPADVRVVPANGGVRITDVDTVGADETIFDIGPKTALQLGELAGQSKTVLWNGPLGVYEKGFVEGTDVVAQAIAHSSAHSIVGGGDTVAELERAGYIEDFSFVSIGGGAMLEFLARGTLPGIQALG